MDALATVATFQLPTEAVVPKGLLEAAGIEVHLKDELTAQVHNFMSQAIGGVKLQVPIADEEHAKAILREAGFLFDAAEETNLILWARIDRITRKLPLIGGIDLLMARLSVVLAIALSVIIVPVVLLTQPTLEERLTGHTWCVDEVQVGMLPLVPDSRSGAITASGYCMEWIRFRGPSVVELPGFGTPRQHVGWALHGDQLHLEGIERHHDIYGEPFTVTVDERSLVLRSSQATIHCSPEPSYW